MSAGRPPKRRNSNVALLKWVTWAEPDCQSPTNKPKKACTAEEISVVAIVVDPQKPKYEAVQQPTRSLRGNKAIAVTSRSQLIKVS